MKPGIVASAVAALLVACSGAPGDGTERSAGKETRRPAESASKEERGGDMDWYVTYTLDLKEGQALVLVYPGGDSTVTLTGMLGPHAEIGHYRARLTEARCTAVRDVLHASGYDGIPPPPPMPPESGFVSVGEGVAGDVPKMHGFALIDLPDPIRPVMAEMEKVAGEIREHPHHVLAGEARWTTTSMKAGKKVSFELTLTNRGTAPAEFLNPAGPEGAELAPLILTVGRDLPPEKFDEERDLDEIQLAPKELTVLGPDGGKLGASETLTIEPGASIRIEATRKAYLAPGGYRGTVTLRTADSSIDESRLVGGVLHVRLGAAAVTK